MTKADIAGAATDGATIREIADEAFAALNSGGRHVLPFSTRYPTFSLNDAYRVTALANKMRVAKIGFTNRRMWDEYGVRAPNWGYIYDRTMRDLAVPLSLAPYTEPKIEPEIMFGFVAAPSPGMDDAALLSCIAWVAHGFEIVQSIFPDWKFSAADTWSPMQCTARCWSGRAMISARAQTNGWIRWQVSILSSIATDS
jgi:2-oxo-3-hexenedioate decarboxylase